MNKVMSQIANPTVSISYWLFFGGGYILVMVIYRICLFIILPFGSHNTFLIQPPRRNHIWPTSYQAHQGDK